MKVFITIVCFALLLFAKPSESKQQAGKPNRFHCVVVWFPVSHEELPSFLYEIANRPLERTTDVTAVPDNRRVIYYTVIEKWTTSTGCPESAVKDPRIEKGE